MRANRFRVVVGFGGALLVAVGCPPRGDPTDFVGTEVSGWLDTQGFSWPGADPIITRIDSTHRAGMTIWSVESTDGDEILQLKVTRGMSPDVATLYGRDQRALLESLYKPVPSPYPGRVTQVIDCPKRFQPLQGTVNSAITYFVAYANTRRSLGICAEDLVAFRALVAFFYCEKTKTFLEIRRYMSPDAFVLPDELTLLKALHCG